MKSATQTRVKPVVASKIDLKKLEEKAENARKTAAQFLEAFEKESAKYQDSIKSVQSKVEALELDAARKIAKHTYKIKMTEYKLAKTTLKLAKKDVRKAEEKAAKASVEPKPKAAQKTAKPEKAVKAVEKSK